MRLELSEDVLPVSQSTITIHCGFLPKPHLHSTPYHHSPRYCSILRMVAWPVMSPATLMLSVTLPYCEASDGSGRMGKREVKTSRYA